MVRHVAQRSAVLVRRLLVVGALQGVVLVVVPRRAFSCFSFLAFGFLWALKSRILEGVEEAQ